jgi:hypothetical protein
MVSSSPAQTLLTTSVLIRSCQKKSKGAGDQSNYQKRQCVVRHANLLIIGIGAWAKRPRMMSMALAAMSQQPQHTACSRSEQLCYPARGD